MNTGNNNLLFGIILGITLLMPSSGFAADPETKPITAPSAGSINSFDLRYLADFNGLKVEAKHQLVPLGDGQYKESLEAKNFLGKVTEQTLFEVSSNGQIIPREYSKQQRLLIGGSVKKQRFDWSTNQLTYTDGDQTQQIEIQSGYLDIMSHKLQLRRDLSAGRKNLSYTVISKGKLKQYQYQVVGHQVLATALGSFNAKVIERVTDDQSKKTTIWLASDWDYLILKLEKLNPGETQEMEITSGRLNNNPLLPLNIDVEN